MAQEFFKRMHKPDNVLLKNLSLMEMASFMDIICGKQSETNMFGKLFKTRDKPY